MHSASQRLRLSYTAWAYPHSHCHADSAAHPEPRRERDQRPGDNAESLTLSHLNTNGAPYPNADTDPGGLFHCLCLRP